MGRRKKLPLPEPGTAYAVPLEDGRIGVCRVLRRNNIREQRNDGALKVLVACSPWIGKKIPDLNHPELRSILIKTHHNWKDDKEVFWVSEPAPLSFIQLGTISPSTLEKRMACYVYGGWESCQYHPVAQWRWDHERAKVLAEDDKEEARKAKEALSAEKNHDWLTLEALRSYPFFKHWKDFPARKAIKASRAIMKTAVKELVLLGLRAPAATKKAVLKECIEAFNDLDEELDNFIETAVREDICDEFELLVHACGLEKNQNMADEWRDW